MIEHECAKCEKDDEPDALCEDRAILPGFRPADTSSLRYSANGFALYVYGLRLTILAPPKFVGQFFADCWTCSISWQGADMYEQLRTSVCRRDEAEASIVFPGSERTCEAHSDA